MSDELTKPLDHLATAEYLAEALPGSDAFALAQAYTLLSIARDLRRLADYMTAPQRVLSGWEDPAYVFNVNDVVALGEARESLGLGYIGEADNT